MRALYFEQWRGGHYYGYIDCLIAPLSGLVTEVILAVTRSTLKEANLEAKFSEANGYRNIRFEIVPEADPSLPIKQRLTLVGNLRDCINRTSPDYVLVPSADAQTLGMGALGHMGLTAIPVDAPIEGTFHAGYGPAIKELSHVLKEAAYRFAFSGSNWTRLNFINFLYYEYAVRHRFRWTRRAQVVPHPIPQCSRLSRAHARRLLSIPEDGRYLGLLGSLDSRKAVPELLAAYRLGKFGPGDRLLLAGRLAPEFRTIIERDYQDLVSSNQLVVIDRFLTDEELTEGYAALDLVCATYRNFPGAASLLLRGLAAGRPVVSHNFGWSRALIRRFRVGDVVDIFDSRNFARTLVENLERSASYIESDATKRLLSFHATTNFTNTMLAGIRQALGKPPLPVKTWEWVLEALPLERRTEY